MKTGYSRQYYKTCIILEPGDDIEDVLEKIRHEGAVFQEGPDELSFVVQFPGRPMELYSESALLRSFPIK